MLLLVLLLLGELGHDIDQLPRFLLSEITNFATVQVPQRHATVGRRGYDQFEVAMVDHLQAITTKSEKEMKLLFFVYFFTLKG